jgi:hypothetical protein
MFDSDVSPFFFDTRLTAGQCGTNPEAKRRRRRRLQPDQDKPSLLREESGYTAPACYKIVTLFIQQQHLHMQPVSSLASKGLKPSEPPST